MTVLRALRATAVGTDGTGTILRVLRATALASAAAHLRLLRATATITTVPVVVPPPPRVVGPGQTVTLTAALADGAADTWAWSIITGPVGVALTGTGATRTLTGTLSVWGNDPTSVVVGIVATQGARTSAQATVEVTVLPQTIYLTEPGGALRGAVTVPA